MTCPQLGAKPLSEQTQNPVTQHAYNSTAIKQTLPVSVWMTVNPLDICFWWIHLFTAITLCANMASFTKEVNQRLAKCPLVFHGRLANRWLTSLVKEATGLS